MKKVTILGVAVLAGLFVAATAQAQITLSTPSGATAGSEGLDEEVIHLDGDSVTNDPMPQYDNPPLYGNNHGNDINDEGITAVANYIATYNPSAHPDNTNYTFLNTVDGFQYGQPVGTAGSGPTNSYLGLDPTGAALTDTATIVGTLFNATGYIDITPALVGDSYTFTITSADDAGRVSIGGQTVIESNYLAPSTGLAYPTSEDVTFDAAGLYAVDVLTYQNGGGANFIFDVTPDRGSSAFSYVIASAAVPEPSTKWLMMGGLLALVATIRRRAAQV